MTRVNQDGQWVDVGFIPVPFPGWKLHYEVDGEVWSVPMHGWLIQDWWDDLDGLNPRRRRVVPCDDLDGEEMVHADYANNFLGFSSPAGVSASRRSFTEMARARYEHRKSRGADGGAK